MKLWPHQQAGLNTLAELLESGAKRICLTGPAGRSCAPCTARETASGGHASIVCPFELIHG